MTWFQALSTLVGCVELVVSPQMFAQLLDGTPFMRWHVLAAALLGVIVGGAQWVALAVHHWRPAWLALGYAVAGLVMLGWIAGECLVVGSFIWPHALWGGLGALQLAGTTIYLGVLEPHPVAPVRRP